VVQNANPISALHEYCKKGNETSYFVLNFTHISLLHNISFSLFAAKIPDPEFECVSETVLESWQKGDKTFKKTEYTMRLEVEGKAYFQAAFTKKAAKTKAAEEAWNVIRVQTFP